LVNNTHARLSRKRSERMTITAGEAVTEGD